MVRRAQREHKNKIDDVDDRFDFFSASFPEPALVRLNFSPQTTAVVFSEFETEKTKRKQFQSMLRFLSHFNVPCMSIGIVPIEDTFMPRSISVCEKLKKSDNTTRRLSDRQQTSVKSHPWNMNG